MDAERMTQDFDEQALIAAARDGELDAFNQLVIHYQRLAYHVAYRILSNADASADATQDAFLRAFKALDQYRGGSFKAWLMRIVTNTCYDQLRAKKRHPTASLEALLVVDPAPGPSFVDRAESPEAYAERQDLSRAIQAGINALPKDQRAALSMCDVAGMSYQEIADAMQTSLGTVKSRISRARAKLRDYLLDQQELLPSKYRLKDED
jgi:RNA polymerase sigma-70 factor (ECF subfamily)